MRSASLNHDSYGVECTETCEPVRSGKGWIYLIYDGGWSYKIGFARNPEKRLAELQTAHAEQLRIVGVLEGTKRTEGELHELFASDHVRGEWFTKTREIHGYFEDHGFICVCPRTPDPECFIHGDGPDWDETSATEGKAS